MSSTCPQCGAQLAPDETCQDRFNLCLVKEFELAAYGAVHHLTVPSYMLQHNIYSRAGWLEAREGLAQFVRQGLMPARARQQNRGRLDSGHRTWSVTKGPKMPGVEAIHWTFTVAEVRLDTAENYCADVRRWAESVLEDSEALIRSFHHAG
jgi:hypothetical protein